MNDKALFQIVDIKGDEHHAGSKAPSDISKIAESMGFKIVPIRMATSEVTKVAAIKRQIKYIDEWKKAFNEIPEGAIVLLQHPFWNRELNREKVLHRLKNEKNVKFISLIHDVEVLREETPSEFFQKEFETMLEMADVLIVHNEVMKEWFLSRGVEEKKIVVLEIFDYLHGEIENHDSAENSDEQLLRFEKCINIAGNLDTKKSGYLSKLGELKNIKIKLYGPNFDETLEQFENVEYMGSFPSDEIPKHLKEGFGLVWDGNELDSCSGEFGQYLKYNNPHKLSLYLSSGLPVVIWKEAAEAKFVQEKHAGVCVGSLKDLEQIMLALDLEEYNELAKNTKAIGRNLREGYYTNKALKEALEKIN